MTEGNISKWAVKEGDSFVAGDILLEIETDKASMDVEAQDDGIMAKIYQGDGSKGIKVGTRIGVLAEPGDDLSSLEIPAEEKKETSSAPKEESKPELKKESKPASESKSVDSSPPAKKSSQPAKEQTRPLLPSVEHLLKEHNISASQVSEMTPSGPNNRLLKGDVLAYIGSISSSYPSELSSKILALSHLDLSNIKLAPPAPKPAAEKEAAAPEVAKELQVAVPISMKAVLEVQKRIQSTLGVFMPLSTFIARATDVANEDLPRSKGYTPSADELFNSILGLDKVTTASGSRGTFLPQITALPSAAPQAKAAKSPTKKADIIDILSGGRKTASSSFGGKTMPGMSNAVNVFSVTVPKGDEKRAQIFLDRVRTVLESEPGRLVL